MSKPLTPTPTAAAADIDANADAGVRVSTAWRVAAALLALLAVLLGTVAQSFAIMALVRPTGAIDPFLLFLCFQVIAGVAEAYICWCLMPREYQNPRKMTMLLLWVLCTFVPVLGGVVILISCLWAEWFPGKQPSDEVVHVPRPEFVAYLISRVSHGGGARLQARVANTQVSASDRLSALVAIQRMPTRNTSALLRELLADPLEDVRLIAYGTLDQAENEIMQRIVQTSKKLDRTGDGASKNKERHALNRLLAELYFELTYQNLVQGEVYKYTVEQADRYAQASLETDNNDAALWVTRGRLALAAGKPDAAHTFLSRALELGFPRERLVPWLAEADFLHGDYDAVGPLLLSLDNASNSSALNPVLKYWSSPMGPHETFH